MVAMYKIERVSDIAGATRLTVKQRPNPEATNGDTRSNAQDTVAIHPETQELARVAAASERQDGESKLRAEQIDRVKQQLESGTYKLQETVLQLAAHIDKYLI